MLPDVPRSSCWRLLAAAGLLSACGATEDPAWFREVAAERGLDWKHEYGSERRYWFPEIMGGGVGLLDLDDDGQLDVYLVQSGDLAAQPAGWTNRFFRNLGQGRFADDTERSGGADAGYGMGCACGDADGDGDLDVYVTNVGPNALWLDQGRTLVVDEQAQVQDPAWSTSAAWFDLEADGDLDLFVTNYVRWSVEQELECRSPYGGQDYCSPNSYGAPVRDTLYENLGAGRFRDVSVAAGLGATFGNGLGVAAGDFDQDGRTDLYVANDMLPNQLWMNMGQGHLVDRALLLGCAVNMNGAAEAGMGTAAIDLEGDGDLDLFVTHLRDETNTFYLNQGGSFSDRTGVLGLASASLPFTGFGLAFADFDRDGRLDLYVGNGAVTRNRSAYSDSDPYAEPDQLLRGVTGPDGQPRFEELLPRGGLARAPIGSTRGLACGDLDSDGDPDLVLVQSGGRACLLETVVSDGSGAGHWIGLSTLERSGSHALGARVSLVAGDVRRHRWCGTAGSYCSSNDPRVLCGLGASSSPVDVRVRWVGGEEEDFGPLEPDRYHTLRRGEGRLVGR